MAMRDNWGRAGQVPPGYNEGFAAGEARERAQYVSDPPHYVRIDGGAQKPRSYGIDGLTFPVAFVVTMVGGAWWGGAQFTSLQSAIERLAERVNQIAQPINERIGRLEAKVQIIEDSRFSIKDHLLFCAEAASSNPGWTCGPRSFPKRAAADDAPPIWQGAGNVATTWTTHEKRGAK